MFDAWIDKYKTVRKPTERVAGYRSAPFGAVAQAVGACAATNPFRFSSEYADDELGLVYYNYRHYNPLDGRWVNRDPIEEKGEPGLYNFIKNGLFFINDYLGMFSVPSLGDVFPGCHTATPPCCSVSDCHLRNSERYDTCKNNVSSGCAYACLPALIGGVASYASCWGTCEASGFIGCSVGAGICYASCWGCKLP